MITIKKIFDLYNNHMVEGYNFIWVMAYSTWKQIRALKGENGKYIWKKGTPLKYTYGLLLCKIIGIDNTLKHEQIKIIKI